LRILLSYNAADAYLTQALRASIFLSAPGLEFSLSPHPCAASPRPKRVKIRDFDGLLLVAGPRGLTVHQQAEWAAATKRAAHDGKFALLPVLAGRNDPPPEEALKNREWFKAPMVTDRDMICSLVRALETSRSSLPPDGLKFNSRVPLWIWLRNKSKAFAARYRSNHGRQ